MNFTMGTGIGALGNPGNTGDGLRLAQSMGAKLWHMNAYSAGLDVRYPGYATNVAASLKGAGYTSGSTRTAAALRMNSRTVTARCMSRAKSTP